MVRINLKLRISFTIYNYRRGSWWPLFWRTPWYRKRIKQKDTHLTNSENGGGLKASLEALQHSLILLSRWASIDRGPSFASPLLRWFELWSLRPINWPLPAMVSPRVTSGHLLRFEHSSAITLIHWSGSAVQAEPTPHDDGPKTTFLVPLTFGSVHHADFTIRKAIYDFQQVRFMIVDGISLHTSQPPAR